MINVMLDTNIVIDFLTNRDPFNKQASQIFKLIKEYAVHAHLSANSLTDIFYMLCKAIGKDAGREAISNLFDIFKIVSITEIDCINAFHSGMADFEDALIAECAVKANLDCIITRDKLFLNHSLAISPDEFLKKLFDA